MRYKRMVSETEGKIRQLSQPSGKGNNTNMRD